MTIRTASPTAAPTPLVIPPGEIAPGRASELWPLRREGPEKLTGTAKYTDDLVFPGAWYGATVRSSEAHARLLGIDLEEGFDWSRVVVVTAADIPGENVVASIKDDQPVLVPVGGEIRHHAEPVCLVAAPDRATLREAKAAVRLRTVVGLVRERRQPVRGDQAKAVPAVLPATPKRRASLDEDVVAAGPAQEPAHHEAGLSGANNDRIDTGWNAHRTHLDLPPAASPARR